LRVGDLMYFVVLVRFAQTGVAVLRFFESAIHSR